MKAKNIFCLVALSAGCIAFTASAQSEQPVYVDEAVTVTEFTCDNSPKYFSNWRQNWFIQLGAGVTQPFVERGMGVGATGHSVERSNMTAVYNFGFGRWFSPYLGVRVNAIGGALHWNNPTLEQPANGWTRGKHAQLSVELMWDMCNSLGGVNPNRPFSVIPYVGIGGDYLWDVRDGSGNTAAGTNIYRRHSETELRNSSWSLPVNAGIQFRVRLCKYVDFFAEARASFYGDNWNLCAYGDPIEANISAIGGLSINIGGRGWDVYNECDYLSRIAALNGQVNDLRAELINCGQTVANLQSQLPCPEQKPTTVVNQVVASDLSTPLQTVRFNIDSDVITPEEKVNVYNIAEWLKENPKQDVNIIGYADKDTGTAEYNLQLSERRANAVADMLVNEYGVNRDRLSVKYDGSSVQPYSTNNWNRVVIVTVK